jgi:hypothetical protein
LVWHLFGRNTARPWDGGHDEAAHVPMPSGEAEPLTDDERRTLVEWIDLGAPWNGAGAEAQEVAAGPAGGGDAR